MAKDRAGNPLQVIVVSLRCDDVIVASASHVQFASETKMEQNVVVVVDLTPVTCFVYCGFAPATPSMRIFFDNRLHRL